MSLYRRDGSPFWQYSFTIDGVRFRGSTGREGKREAALVEEERKHELRHRRKLADPWRLRDCLGAYWNEHAKHKRSGATFVFAKLDALSRILGRDTLIADLTNPRLMDYRAKRQAEGLQLHSVNRDLACLHAALRHAEVMHGQHVPKLAWSKIKVAEPPNRIRFLSRDEYDALLAVCDSGLARIVIFAVATGLRKTNILELDWREVDLASARVTVRIKGDKLHSVPLTAQVRAMLATERDRTGQVFDTRRFRRRWEKAVRDAELEDFRFHDLRHTFASWARMAGADIADICEALGHSNISVTMRYAHIEPAHHVTAFDRVSGAVWSHSETQSREKRDTS